MPSRIMETTEERDGEETAVSDLRSELWVKERELTDIRLEALSSAHQLEQLREAMNNMQVRLACMHSQYIYLWSIFVFNACTCLYCSQQWRT